MEQEILKEIKELKELLRGILNNQEHSNDKETPNYKQIIAPAEGDGESAELFDLEKGEYVLNIPKSHIFIKAIEAQVFLNGIAEDEEEARRIAELLLITSVPL
ncbi:hypothetical protein [Trichococcus flocculiformis]|uniref:hypothetical protein n=1 Tax=Trichococcus flocculiformis TaxID=82803 RepID=UPI003DA57CF4